MKNGIKLQYLMAIILIAMILPIGCSGGGVNPVTLPENPPPASQECDLEMDRAIWGVWDIGFDTDQMTVVVEPVRNIEMHYDVTDYLLPPACGDCIEITLEGFNPNGWVYDFTVTLKNPTTLTAYDVRGTLLIGGESDDRELVNADEYTELFDDSIPPDRNPFKVFAFDQPEQIFAPESTHEALYSIAFPLPHQFNMKYVVDASFPVNQKEPYSIYDQTVSGYLDDIGGSTAQVSVYVSDWQDNVEWVRLDVTPLGAPAPIDFIHFSGEEWQLEIVNEWGAVAGDYELWIEAKSEGNSLILYDKLNLTVEEVENPLGWARTFGAGSFDVGVGTAVDESGNVYAVGYYSDTVDFDPGQGTEEHDSQEEGGAYLSKFNSDGKFQWARCWGGFSIASKVVVDATGDIYVIGAFGGEGDFDPGPGVDARTPALGMWGSFLMRFDTDSEFYWALTWSAENFSNEESFVNSDVATDGQGNIYVTGHFDTEADLDPGPDEDIHFSGGGKDIFLSKFNTAGEYQWGRTWGGPLNEMGFGGPKESGYGIDVDSSGNVYVSGFFGDTVDFDPGPEVDEYTAYWGSFLSKFNSSGDYIWARIWGDPSSGVGVGFGVTIDDSDNIYTAGIFNGIVDFDPGVGEYELQSIGSYDAYLCKLDSSGLFQWANGWGSSGTDWCFAASFDPNGFIYVTGNVEGTTDLDPGPGVDSHSGLGYDLFLSKFDLDGNYQWGFVLGGVEYEYGHDVATSDSGDVLVTGSFRSQDVDFNPGPGVDEHSTNGSSDVYLLKFPPDGNW